MRNFIFIILVFVLSVSYAQEEKIDRLFRFPAISDSNIVFTYAGDLYLVDKEGGLARKLTSGEGYEMFARFSPDGSSIAFTGQYDGNTEVFTINKDGGEPKRLTYTATLNRDDISDRMGPNNIVTAWTPDGENIIYRSRKQSFNSFKGSLFSVSKDGGMSTQLPLPYGGFCSYSADGKQLAYNQVMREFRTWKYYKGGMADDIWVYNFDSKETQNITNNDAQDIFPMWFGGKIFFISDRDKTMNLFSYNTATEQVEKLTQFTDFDIKFPSIYNNMIVFENGGYIYSYLIDIQELKKIDIEIKNDFPESRNKLVDASKYINTVSLSANAKRLAVSARGDVFSIPVEKGVAYNFTNTPGAFDRDVVWSPDGEYIAYLSDKSGEYEIYIQKSDGKSSAIQLSDKGGSYKFEIMWSPDSKKILYSDKAMDLFYIDIQSKAITKVAHSPSWEIRDYTWSPDSKWISYADNDGNGMNQIYIYNTENGGINTVTDNWYESSSPSFSLDGKYLFFISKRIFTPQYSETEWNHSYGNMSKIYFITLKQDDKGPFALEDAEAITKKKASDEKKEEQKLSVIIDFEDIANRVVELPIDAGHYWNVTATDHRVYYNQFRNGQKGSMMKMYDLKKEKENEIGKNLGYEIAVDAKKMLISNSGNYYVVDYPSAKLNLKDPISKKELKVWVNLHQEWEQIYEEAWRQMRDFFYDPQMHGADWQAMHDKYAVLVPYVNNRNDLNYIIGELIGELNIGHAYTGGGDRAQPKRYKTGLLGANIISDESGYFKIDKILKGENYRKELRSPLREVGLNISEGSYIIAVDGKDCKDYSDFYELMFNKAGKYVSLTINENASTDGAHEIIVKPIADESKLYYYNWVQGNIEKVSKATDGRVGYIHIPDMGRGGLNEFVKYFYPQLNKKALIIDDRGNGGGNVSPMIIERLRREITRANTLRNAKIPTQTPTKMMRGDMVLLVNGYSASDGDLFPYSFRKHGLGKIIGTRTWGGVVGIRGSLPFIDGGNLTRPEFASYSSDGAEWIIEGHGIDPDIVVENDPTREFMGIDQQLNRAIEEVLKTIDDYKELPAPPPYPVKAK